MRAAISAAAFFGDDSAKTAPNGSEATARNPKIVERNRKEGCICVEHDCRSLLLQCRFQHLLLKYLHILRPSSWTESARTGQCRPLHLQCKTRHFRLRDFFEAGSTTRTPLRHSHPQKNRTFLPRHGLPFRPSGQGAPSSHQHPLIGTEPASALAVPQVEMALSLQRRFTRMQPNLSVEDGKQPHFEMKAQLTTQFLVMNSSVFITMRVIAVHAASSAAFVSFAFAMSFFASAGLAA